MPTMKTVHLPRALTSQLQIQASDARRIVLMTCGISGSGKSTLSKTVTCAYPSFIRLSIDQYIHSKHGIFAVDYPTSQYDAYQSEARTALRAQLRKILREGVRDVVLDFAFPTRDARDEYRRIAAEGGARVVLVYLERSEEALWERICRRREDGIDADSAFEVTREVLSRYVRGFEAPVDEGEIVISEAQSDSSLKA